MKSSLLLFAFVLSAVWAAGQNLVPNPSFEEFTDCPNSLDDISHASGWSSFRLTPDYFNACDPTDIVSVPVNQFSTGTNALHGVAYAGYGQLFIPSGFSESIGVELTTPLLVGNTYFVSFYVRRGTTPTSNCWMDRIGAKFTTQAFLDWPLDVAMPITGSAHIEYPGLVQSTDEWTWVNGYFTADSAYTHLVIGNHFEVDQIEVECDQIYTNYYTYYFVDCVCVAGNPEECGDMIGLNEFAKRKDLIVFPNPFHEFLSVRTNGQSPIRKIELMTAEGQMVREMAVNGHQTEVRMENTAQLRLGFYIIKCYFENGLIHHLKILKN